MPTKPPQDEDDNNDWETEGGATVANPTLVAIGDPVTAPHDLAPVAEGIELEIAKSRDAGYRKGFADGQTDAVSAFVLTFQEGGLSDDENRNILLKAEGKLTRL